MLVSFMHGRNYPAALALEPENGDEKQLCGLFVKLVRSGKLELRFCDTIRTADPDDDDSDTICIG